MFPILITVTLFRDGRKILINANHIEEIMDGKSIQSAEDDFYDACHLSDVGAKKFSNILRDKIVN